MEEAQAPSCFLALRELLDEYASAIRDAYAARKPGVGILGFGPKPADDPCHEAFDRKIAALCGKMADGETPGAELADAAQRLLGTETERSWPVEARWTLIASQRHFLPLISRLPAQKRREMYTAYAKRCPRFQRLPLQQALLKALSAPD